MLRKQIKNKYYADTIASGDPRYNKENTFIFMKNFQIVFTCFHFHQNLMQMRSNIQGSNSVCIMKKCRIKQR